MILPKNTVGRGAAIAASAVITQSVDPLTVAEIPTRQDWGTRTLDLYYTLSHDVAWA